MQVTRILDVQEVAGEWQHGELSLAARIETCLQQLQNYCSNYRDGIYDVEETA